MQDGEVELPPRQLLDEDIDARPPGSIGRRVGFHRLRENRADREQPEAEILGNARSPIGRRKIAFGGVGLDFSGHGALQTPAGRAFARFGQIGGGHLPSPVRHRRQRQRGNYRRCLERRRFADRRGFGQRQPVAAVWGVNLVRLTALSQHLIRRMKRDIVMGVAFHPQLGAHPAHPLFNSFSEWIRIGIEMQHRRAGLADQAAQAFHRVALAEDQPSANGFQIARQRFQAATEEMLAFRPGPRV